MKGTRRVGDCDGIHDLGREHEVPAGGGEKDPVARVHRHTPDIRHQLGADPDRAQQWAAGYGVRLGEHLTPIRSTAVPSWICPSGEAITALSARAAVRCAAPSPFVIDRLESVSAGTASVEVRFTQKVIDLGAPKVAKILQRTALADLAESYSFVHLELPDDRYHDARVYLQDLLVERAAATAQVEKLDAREVRALLADGSAVIRVLAVGLMSGDTSLADGPSIAAAIGSSQSKNEQYHALRLAERCWNRLPKPDRQAIRVVVEEAVSSGAIRPGNDRRPLAEAILGLPLG
jgi:hypothetical protein